MTLTLEWVRYRRYAHRDHLLDVDADRTLCGLSAHGMLMPYAAHVRLRVVPTCAGCLRALS